jgi:hypothetical protein
MNRVQVMHLNAGKRKAVQHGLLSDDTIKGFTALAVVEPYIFKHPQTGVPTISQDRHWQIFEPTEKRRDGHARHAFRAALWVNRRCRAISIPANSYDVAAALIRLQDRSLVVMACYEARNARTEVERETDFTSIALACLWTPLRPKRKRYCTRQQLSHSLFQPSTTGVFPPVCKR